MKSREWILATSLALAAPISGARGDNLVLDCSRDNTLIQDGGDVSNGAGDGIYSGLTLRAGARRALMRFDAASIPPGSTITSVSLQLTLLNTNGGDGPATLYRLLADWGEGSSNSSGGIGAPAAIGDATWLQRFFNTAAWATPGGDFASAASSTTTILTINATQTFPSTANLVADVQGWVNAPAQNFGWVMIGDEATPQSVYKMASREYFDPLQRPRLFVTFTPPARPCVADFNESGVVSVQDIFDFLAAFFANDPRADFNGANGLSVQDIFDFLAAYFAGCN